MNYSKTLSKTYKMGVGEIAQWLRPFTDFAEDLSSRPPAPILGDSQPPVSLDPGDSMLSSGSGALDHSALVQAQDKST